MQVSILFKCLRWVYSFFQWKIIIKPILSKQTPVFNIICIDSFVGGVAHGTGAPSAGQTSGESGQNKAQGVSEQVREIRQGECSPAQRKSWSMHGLSVSV